MKGELKVLHIIRIESETASPHMVSTLIQPIQLAYNSRTCSKIGSENGNMLTVISQRRWLTVVDSLKWRTPDPGGTGLRYSKCDETTNFNRKIHLLAPEHLKPKQMHKMIDNVRKA